MIITRDGLPNSDIDPMPIGWKVEAPAFHVAVTEALVPTTPESRSALRQKVDGLKSRGLSKLHGMERTIGDRTSVMKRSMHRSMTNAKTSMRAGVDGQLTKIQSSMHTSPMKWAAIAAGAGFAIGMLGRLMERRNKRQQRMPQLVIIETC